jgi:hypothetical protein
MTQRITSDNRKKAARENGGRSRGPVSSEGKERSCLNGVKSGLFSKKVVLPCIGESVDEFEDFREQKWSEYQPQGPAEEMLTNEVIETYWLWQRPRRCEAAEIRRQSETVLPRRLLAKQSQPSILMARFLRDHQARRYPADGQSDAQIVEQSLSATREEFRTSSAGLEVLIDLLGSVIPEVRAGEHISPESELLLIDALGPADQCLKILFNLNRVAKVGLAQVKKSTNSSVGKAEGYGAAENKELPIKDLLIMEIESVIRSLQVSKNAFLRLEEIEESCDLETLVLPPAGKLEKIHRAEAALGKRFYRAFDRLMLLQTRRKDIEMEQQDRAKLLGRVIR